MQRGLYKQKTTKLCGWCDYMGHKTGCKKGKSVKATMKCNYYKKQVKKIKEKGEKYD